MGSGLDPFDISSMGSCLLPIDTYGLSLTVSELFCLPRNRFRPPARPSDPDKVTNTAQEAAASSSGNKN